LVPGIRRNWQIEVEAESLGEGGAAPRDSRPHGSHGNVEHLGDLGVVEVCDVAKHDRSTQVVGKIGEGLVENQAIADTVDVVSGSVVSAFDCAVVTIVESRSAVTLSEFVERRVRGDAIRPGTER
jgi:hypothetical protein